MTLRNLGDVVVRGCVREMLRVLVPDSDREGLRQTPQRVEQAWKFWTSGYSVNEQELLKVFEDGADGYDQMIFEGCIPLFSHCEHHMTAFFGVAHIGYIPNKAKPRIVGLSKFGRLVNVYARRLQVQERLTTQIAEAMVKHLEPMGVGVVLRCRHLCMESRGVQTPGVITYTSAVHGNFRHDEAVRAEWLHFVQLADSRSTTL